jgi:uncharacterized protein YndB with AHSA1/START domain
MTVSTSQKSETSGPTLVIERIFDAPRELVWRAWTEPEHFMMWWGPKDFTAPKIRMDLRVGGTLLWCMQGKDGKEYWTTGVYREIDPPKRLVYTDAFSDENGNRIPASQHGLPFDWPDELMVTVTLEEIGGKTKMTLTHTGIPAGEMSEMTQAGWNESFDKLAQSLK